jgi:enterochelin esterase family protein
MAAMNFLQSEQFIQAALRGNREAERILAQTSLPLVHGNLATFVFRGAADAVALQHWVFGLQSQIALERIGDSEWWVLTLELPLQSRIEYKFVVRSGGSEAWLLDPRNPRIAHDPFGGNSVVHMTDYVEPAWTLPQSTLPQGTLETWTIQSRALGDERGIRVYLPPRYRANRRHRVLILHDGDDYLKYSRLATVLDNLTESLEIPPLVVALLNPGDRLREYGADPGHAAFVVEELLPELGRRYSVIDDPSARCLGGASFGAVASLATAWYYPRTFDLLLLQSGSFAFTDIGRHMRGPEFDPVVEFMNRFRGAVGEPAKKIYVSCGVYENLIYENRSLVPLLQSAGPQVRFEEARDGHNWENWRDRLRSGLTWLFPVPLWFYYE